MAKNRPALGEAQRWCWPFASDGRFDHTSSTCRSDSLSGFSVLGDIFCYLGDLITDGHSMAGAIFDRCLSQRINWASNLYWFVLNLGGKWSENICWAQCDWLVSKFNFTLRKIIHIFYAVSNSDPSPIPRLAFHHPKANRSPGSHACQRQCNLSNGSMLFVSTTTPAHDVTLVSIRNHISPAVELAPAKNFGAKSSRCGSGDQQPKTKTLVTFLTFLWCYLISFPREVFFVVFLRRRIEFRREERKRTRNDRGDAFF